jgi:hypothetical protein
MNDRIQIDGVWYTKETKDNEPKKEVTLDPTGFEGCVVENDEACFEVIRTKKDDGTYYSGIDIKYTNKRNNEVQFWDNNSWMIGVLDNNPTSLNNLPDDLSVGGLELLKAFFKYLASKEVGWLVRSKSEDTQHYLVD